MQNHYPTNDFKRRFPNNIPAIVVATVSWLEITGTTVQPETLLSEATKEEG
jgi:hypothetical protein